MSADARYPDMTSQTVQLLRDHGATDPVVFLNGRGVPRLDLSWYDLVHEGEPPASWTDSRNLHDYCCAYREVVRRALADGVERLLITEDDLEFSPSFSAVMTRAQVPDDWQLLYYGAFHYWASEPASHVAPYVVRLNGGQLGIQAVGWRREAMERFLETPNDRTLDRVVAGMHTEIPSYCLEPSVIRQAQGVRSVVDPREEPFSANFLYQIRS